MTEPSQAYLDAERAMDVPPVATRGRTNQNPAGLGFWALVAEDFATHERKFFEQGFWAVFVHRFGNWRMDQPKILRAPATLLYRIMFKLVEWLCGISLWYTVKLGRRVRIWHHSGMSLGARAIGDDVHIRQNTTLGVAQTGRNADLPIIGPRADIGAGACIAGAVYVGADAKIGANALVITDIPDGATAMGNPAQVYGAPAPAREEPANRATLPATAAPAPTSAPASAPAPALAAAPPESPLETPRDLGVIALLGSANLDYLAMSFAEVSARQGLAIDTYVPAFGQARMECLQDPSPLVEALEGRAAATLIAERAEDILGEVYTAPLSLAPEDAETYLAEALQPMLQLVHDARRRLSGPIFVLRLFALTRSTLGQADAGSERGLAALIGKANEMIEAEVAPLSDIHLLDGAGMVAEVGRQAADPGQYWHIGRVPFSPAFGDHLARRTLGAILALRGASARIVVLDLDNTLWGGVLGEDGMEGLEIGGAYPGSAYRAFQDALRALSQRGIALAVASKNEEDLALKMMAEHPEMALRPDDIVNHRIRWDEKSHGIQDMLDEIGIGPGNAMFIDDNPVEREKARRNVPGLIVPPFPTAPEDLVGWLLDSPYLDCLELTSSDLGRTAQYKVRARETAARRSFASIEDFYRDLQMRLTFEPYGPANQKRVLQLFAKTNQFNATLRRHDAGAVQRILDEGGEVHAVGVADRHSPYELMGVIVLRPHAAMQAAYPDDVAVQHVTDAGAWWIDSFLLSCRILGRTIETAIVAWATARAAEKGATQLIGQVIEAPRNTPVRDVFAKSGMQPVQIAIDMGAGGLYTHLLDAGPLVPPDYFEIGNTPPPAAPSDPEARKSVPKPPAGIAPPATGPMPPHSNGATRAQAALPLDPGLDARLAETFRKMFRLEPDADIENASMETVARWDSLAHLKLMMEVEQKVGIRLPGEAAGRITSYAGLRAAVAERA